MNLPAGTLNDKSAPWNQGKEAECSCCHEWLNEYELMDACEIDGRTFCDKCASDMSFLRFEEFISPVSDKTKKLVKAEEMRLYNEAADRLHPYRKVTHI